MGSLIFCPNNVNMTITVTVPTSLDGDTVNNYQKNWFVSHSITAYMGKTFQTTRASKISQPYVIVDNISLQSLYECTFLRRL